uniref:Uncharacterized protein n=1 Tax=Trypanosoma congolense (strain IL3000) TaxID=1068625 RepID=G0UQQ5_TRYCI|nr:conserved hypothetical protein [Trypanosoma congolense IL3000]
MARAHIDAELSMTDAAVPSYVLYSPQGSKPLAALDVVGGNVICSYDKGTKSQLLRISPATHVSFLPKLAPRSRTGSGSVSGRGAGCSLTSAAQRVIILQLFCEEPTRVAFAITIELLIQGKVGRHRLIFSNNFHKLQRCAQHVKVPLKCIVPRVWSNIVFDVSRIYASLHADLAGRASSGEHSQSRKLLQFTLTCSSVCRVRRLLGMPQIPVLGGDDVLLAAQRAEWPLSLRLPSEVPVSWWIIRTCEEEFLDGQEPALAQQSSQEGRGLVRRNVEAVSHRTFEASGQHASLTPNEKITGAYSPLCGRRTEASCSSSWAQSFSPPAGLFGKAPNPRNDIQTDSSTNLVIKGQRVDERRSCDYASATGGASLFDTHWEDKQPVRRQQAHSHHSAIRYDGTNRNNRGQILAWSRVTPSANQVREQMGSVGLSRQPQVPYVVDSIENAVGNSDGSLATAGGLGSIELMRERVKRIQEIIRECEIYPEQGCSMDQGLRDVQDADIKGSGDDHSDDKPPGELSSPYSHAEQVVSTEVHPLHQTLCTTPPSDLLQSVKDSRADDASAQSSHPSDNTDKKGGAQNFSDNINYDELDEDERFTVNIIRMSSSPDLAAAIAHAETASGPSSRLPMSPRVVTHNVDRLCFDSSDVRTPAASLRDTEGGAFMEWTDVGATPHAEKDTTVVSNSHLATPAENALDQRKNGRVIRAGRLSVHSGGLTPGASPLPPLPPQPAVTAETVTKPLVATPAQSFDRSVDSCHGLQRCASVCGTTPSDLTYCHSQRCGHSVDEESNMSVIDYRRAAAGVGTDLTPQHHFMFIDSGRGFFDGNEEFTRRNSYTNLKMGVNDESLLLRCVSLPPLSPAPSTHFTQQRRSLQVPVLSSPCSVTAEAFGRNGNRGADSVDRNTEERGAQSEGELRIPSASVSFSVPYDANTPREIERPREQRNHAEEAMGNFLVFDPVLKCYLDTRSNTYVAGSVPAVT